MKTLSRTCTVAGVALLTAFTGTTAAHAATATVPAEGTLLVGGAGLGLSLTFDCDAGQTADLFVDTAQTVDGTHIAGGTTVSDTVTCADGEETVDVVLLAAGDFAFTEGDALVQIALFTCAAEACGLTTVSGPVRLVPSPA